VMVRSSSATRVAGISPATILQKRQSGSAAMGGRVACRVACRTPPSA
jgi:hypothetical protein